MKHLRLLLIFSFLGLFLLWPLGLLCIKAFSLGAAGIALPVLSEQTTWISLFTSVNLSLVVTAVSLLLAIVFSVLISRFDFPFSSVFRFLLILPIVVPPFVSGIGIRKIFSRFGPLNSALMELGLIGSPIDWLGLSGFVSVALAEALHYYPILLMSLLSSFSALDYSLIQAARIGGASRLRVLLEIYCPLFLPSTLASLFLVFAWSFTELGTPLVFDYHVVLPAQLYSSLDDLNTNPRGYIYVLLVLFVTLGCGLGASGLANARGGLSHAARGAVKFSPKRLGIGARILVFFFLSIATLLVLLPHVGVLALSLSKQWNMSFLMQQVSAQHYGQLVSHPLVLRSLGISLLLSTGCCLIVLMLGLLIVFAQRADGRERLLSACANASLVIPGLVLAYAYLESFRETLLDPRINPLPLLAFGYALRRLPIMTNSLQSALKVSNRSLEEAALVSGASKINTFKRISFPLAKPFVISALILCFAFSMFEVSESLMLAQREEFFPLSKCMYALLNRPDGVGVACALGVLAFIFTIGALVLAARLSGRRIDQLFRTA